MPTTIQVTEMTRQRLELAKRKLGAKSLDETIQRMLDQQSPAPKSMFGSLKGKIKPFTRRERHSMWQD